MQEIVSEHLQTSQLAVDNPCWYHAMTLMERKVSLQAQRSVPGREEPYDCELATRRLQEWKKQDVEHKGINLAQRLEYDDLTEEDLLVLLGEPIEAVQQRTQPPDWLVQLAEVFTGKDPGFSIEEEFTNRLPHFHCSIFSISLAKYAYDYLTRRATMLMQSTLSPFLILKTIASAFLPNMLLLLSYYQPYNGS